MMRGLFFRLKEFARIIKGEIHVIYLVARHPRTPRLAKVLAVLVVGYALSPIDLIPDFIPILGYLDDLILVPLGIYFLLKIVPQDVLIECRSVASKEAHESLPSSNIAALVIVFIWLVVFSLIVGLFTHRWVLSYVRSSL